MKVSLKRIGKDAERLGDILMTIIENEDVVDALEHNGLDKKMAIVINGLGDLRDLQFVEEK